MEYNVLYFYHIMLNRYWFLTYRKDVRLEYLPSLGRGWWPFTLVVRYWRVRFSSPLSNATFIVKWRLECIPAVWWILYRTSLSRNVWRHVCGHVIAKRVLSKSRRASVCTLRVKKTMTQAVAWRWSYLSHVSLKKSWVISGVLYPCSS